MNGTKTGVKDLEIAEIGTTDWGKLVVNNYNGRGYAFFLTPCCDASAKGMDGGVGCRSCYEYVDQMYGDGSDVRDKMALKKFLSCYLMPKDVEKMMFAISVTSFLTAEESK